MKETYQRVAKRVRSVEERARVSERKRVRASWYVWRVLVQVVRQWRRDRCPEQAAASSFQTILAVVPALALGLAAFRITGALGAESVLVDFLSREFLPFSRQEIAGQLLGFSENIRVETLGIVGFVSTLFIAFVVFDGLERRINLIWRVHERRPLYKRVVVFFLTLAIAPPLFGLSLFYGAELGLADGWTGVCFSVLVTYVAVFLLGYLLPHTFVQVRSVALGAGVTTILSECAKFGFTTYVGTYGFDRYAGIYGTLAVAPLCLIWIYWTWLMLFLGVEVSHAVQNFHLLEGAAYPVMEDLGTDIERNVNATTATAILLHLAKAPEGQTRTQLVQHFRLSDDCVRLVCRRLDRAGLLRVPDGERAIRLAKDDKDISVADVHRAMDDHPPLELERPHASFLAGDAYLDWLRTREQEASEVSLADLSSRAESIRDEPDV